MVKDVESLKFLKVYVGKQLKDIATWDGEDESEVNARIDELQCLETYLDFLIAKDTDTLDEHYEKLFCKD